MLLISAALALAMQTNEPHQRPVLVAVLAGKCRVTVDGTPVDYARLRLDARDWARTETLVQFEVMPEADVDCLDRALKILIKTPGIKLGFFGNEEEAPAPRP